MALPGKAKKVTIFVGQPQGEHHQAYLQVMERLKAEGAAGATAFKAVAAFGARSRVQSLRLSEIVPDLPTMIVWIDTPERVERILPHIRGMVAEGLIAVEETDVVLYTTASLPDLPAAMSVEEVMTRDVVTVGPDAAMAEVVADLLERGIRSVPVVDAERHVIGIITNSDLVARGGLPVRLELLRTFETPQLHDALQRLSQQHREADEVMTAPVVTVGPGVDVRQAAAILCRRGLKRLPVVDGDNRLLGIVSRADLLRSVLSGPVSQRPDGFPHVHAEGDSPVRTIMSTDAPVVREDARLPAVVDAVLSTRLNRAVVVDGDQRVVGVVTDSELVERLTPEARPGLIASLMHRLPFAHSEGGHQSGNRARDVMIPAVTVREDEPIRDVLATMLAGPRKIMPVVDGEGRLVGAVDRAHLLAVLAGV
jgi:CBS-domain-containing membrane protein/PII-like signaling protein